MNILKKPSCKTGRCPEDYVLSSYKSGPYPRIYKCCPKNAVDLSKVEGKLQCLG